MEVAPEAPNTVTLAATGFTAFVGAYTEEMAHGLDDPPPKVPKRPEVTLPPSKKGFGSKAACALPPDNPDNDIGMKSACVFVRPIGEKMAPDWDRGGCAVEGDGGATSGAASARDGLGFEGEDEW